MYKPIALPKRDTNADAVAGRDTTGEIVKQMAKREYARGKNAFSRIGEKASDYAEGLRTLAPGDSEVAGIKAVQENVDQAKQGPIPEEEPRVNAPVDRIRPTARYGSQPGEQRLDWALKPIPSYDAGTPLVSEDQVAQLHAGEAVVPANENPNNPDAEPKFVPAPKEPGLPRIQPERSEVPDQLITSEPEDQRGTPQERAAIATDKRNAMGQGVAGLKNLGLAKIHEAHLEPSTSDVTGPITERPTAGLPRIAAPQEMHQDTAGGALIPGAPSDYDKGTRQDFSRMEYKAKLADFDKRIQNALSLATPEGQETADRLSLAKQELVHHTPWGSESNHPGILGRIGHIAGKVGSIVGDIVAPATMSLIPGTEAYRAAQHNATLGRIQMDTPLATARAVEETAAKKEPINKEWQEISGGAIDPKHPELGAQPAFYSKNNPDEGVKFGNVPLAPKAGAEKNAPATPEQIADYKQRISNSGLTGNAAEVYGSAPAGATAAELDKRFDEATKLRGMNTADAKNRIDEQARADAAAEHKREHEETRGSKLVNYRDKNGDLVSGTRSEAQEAGVQNKDIHGETSAPLQEKARQAYTQYGRILENTQSALDTMPAWNNETDRKAAMDVSKQYWEHLSGSVVVAGVGVNPEYTQQFINSDAYRKMSPKGQEHMQNMFQLWSDAINIAHRTWLNAYAQTPRSLRGLRTWSL